MSTSSLPAVSSRSSCAFPSTFSPAMKTLPNPSAEPCGECWPSQFSLPRSALSSRPLSTVLPRMPMAYVLLPGRLIVKFFASLSALLLSSSAFKLPDCTTLPLGCDNPNPRPKSSTSHRLLTPPISVHPADHHQNLTTTQSGGSLFCSYCVCVYVRGMRVYCGPICKTLLDDFLFRCFLLHQLRIYKSSYDNCL